VNKQIVSDILKISTKLLCQSGVNAPRLSAELIVAKVLGISRLDVLTSMDRPVAPHEQVQITSLLYRRLAGEPLAYITGTKEFYGLEFHVCPDVLIPRPETEIIVELVQDFFPKDASFLFADICTGSGNLAVTLARQFPYAQAIATDLSYRALQVADKNVCHYDLGSQILLVQADLGQSFRSQSFHLIVSNPPYLSFEAISSLSVEISGYEPRLALVGGPTGLEIPFQVLEQSHAMLRSGGLVMIEIGGEYIQDHKHIFKSRMSPWKEIVLCKDYNGCDRILVARKV
jgi:release factor glutamine methyltransferase